MLTIANSDDYTTWVCESYTRWERNNYLMDYVYKDGTYKEPHEIRWTSTKKTYTLNELNDMIYKTSCSEKEYSFLHNNCHDFAKELYRMCT